MLHDHQALLELVERLDIRAGGASWREDSLLDGIKLVFQPS
jgi:hypothetical protein